MLKIPVFCVPVFRFLESRFLKIQKRLALHGRCRGCLSANGLYIMEKIKNKLALVVENIINNEYIRGRADRLFLADLFKRRSL